MYPSRHGAVPTRAWEAIRDAIQHGNLATMLKERATARNVGGRYAELVASGSGQQLIADLLELEAAEAHNAEP